MFNKVKELFSFCRLLPSLKISSTWPCGGGIMSLRPFHCPTPRKPGQLRQKCLCNWFWLARFAALYKRDANSVQASSAPLLYPNSPIIISYYYLCEFSGTSLYK
jgi:hypothetical protein